MDTFISTVRPQRLFACRRNADSLRRTFTTHVSQIKCTGGGIIWQRAVSRLLSSFALLHHTTDVVKLVQ